MPRKTSVSDAAGLKVTQVVDYFRKANLIAADVALDLAQEVVASRHKDQNKAIQRATSGKPTAQTETATATAAEKPARRKPGPAKGFKKNKGAQGPQAVAPAENTGADLPPQTASDLPLSDEPVGAGAVNVG